jgi:hypothetical protein
MLTDELLNVAAYVLLRFRKPLEVQAALARIGPILPQLHTRRQIQRASAALGRRGTCLSRALAVAARAPEAEVVIGVCPPGETPFRAHAWLELQGEPLDPSDPSGAEIARLARLGSEPWATGRRR